MEILRHILAVIAGLVTGSIIIYLIQIIGHQIFPPPAGVDPTDPESLHMYSESISAGALWMVILAYAAGAFTGGFVAALIAPKTARIVALVTGGIFTVFGIINLMLIPHPVWFIFVSLSVYLPFAFLGYLTASSIKSRNKHFEA
ncbi:MAG: hypothetical protein ACLFPE_00800 [Bacteroidales bacterium]